MAAPSDIRRTIVRGLLRPAASAFLALAAIGCGGAPQEPERQIRVDEPVRELPSPAAEGAAEPRLFASAGRVHMSWIEPVPTGHAVRFATLDGRGWSNPSTIIEADDLFVNWADFPSVVETSDGALVAHWLQRSGPGAYAYDVRMSRSEDGGSTWSVPMSPHDDGTFTEHGFVTLVPEPDGSVTAVWLDGRETTSAAEPMAGEHGGGPMTLRSARVDASGSVSGAALLDARTCDCCQTGAALVGNDLVVVYRDRSDEEVRDIWSVARRAGEWSEPTRLSHDEWKIPGCPVNGPAIDAHGTDLVVAWFALVDGVPEVKAVFSRDGGRGFGDPILIERGTADAATLGRVDAEWIDADTAVVTWLTGLGPEAEVRYRTIERNGSVGAVAVAARTRSTRSSGFPRVARDRSRLVLAWTVPGEESPEIRVGEIRLAERQ
jgi:hypothetical protein